MKRTIHIALSLALSLLAACMPPANNGNAANTNAADTSSAPPANASAVVTLPLLDAMLYDERFAGEIKSELQLTDEQVNQLRATASEATGALREVEGDEEYTGTTAAARQRAVERIEALIGRDKASRLFAMVGERWNNGGMPATPNAVPTDTRIVINAPAFRMDVFQNGSLVETYRIGIGYPEFPLPTGLRQADSIIFNPTWTPPDEPWVERGSSRVKVGETVPAGDRRNPLGIAKIPIGLPSLIHGGKAPARIGNFASHGCVGLTDAQMEDFAGRLAELGGAQLTDAQLAAYQKNPTETQTLRLNQPVPVELRYETIVVENGNLRIFRDVYDRGTNTEANLRAVLQAHGVAFDQLSESERAQVMEALNRMSRDASGNPVSPANANGNTNGNNNGNAGGRVTRNIKGEKEIIVPVAALAGKGYPAPTKVNDGSTESAAAANPRRR